MDVTQLLAPISLDSIRLTIESMMRQRPQSIFFAAGGEDNEDLPVIVSTNTIVLKNVDETDLLYPTGVMTELTYSTVAGRLEIDGLTTSGLPNNRRYWTSFGQLFEDVFFGRIPELLTARFVWLDQNTSKLYWGDGADDLGANVDSSILLLVATESKASSDFFE